VPIARVALPVASGTTFDYWAPEALRIVRGSVVRVHLGPRKLTGVVMEVVAASEVAPEKLQTITAVAAIPPVTEDVLEMAAFVASYYQEPIGMAAALAVPPLGVGGVGRRPADSALALAALGRAALPDTLARSPTARALFAQMADAPAGLSAATIAALPAHARRIVTTWAVAALAQDRPYIFLFVPEAFLAANRQLAGVQPGPYADLSWNIPQWRWPR
jgi:primosomal protein N'